jgi:hypothetical protein
MNNGKRIDQIVADIPIVIHSATGLPFNYNRNVIITENGGPVNLLTKLNVHL